jgi:pilus assembly protein Flp/PilA
VAFLRTGVKVEVAMTDLIARIGRFLKSEDGPTAVEYAIMLALIILVCVFAIKTLGINSNSVFDSVTF